jgi:hypothetical protein
MAKPGVMLKRPVGSNGHSRSMPSYRRIRVTPPLDHLSHPQVGLPQTEEDFLPAGRQGGGAEGHCFVAVLEFAWLKIRGLGPVGMLRERPVRPDGAP